jgi:endonuclease G
LLHNPLDRGHLVRRADAAWGRTPEDAKLANDDTFHWTNCSPQHEIFNESSKSSARGLLLWGDLENHIANQGGKRVSVFNGPVFRRTDRKHRGLKVPRQFWKIVAFKNDAGEPEAVAFLLSQKELIKTLPAEEFVVGPFEPYQVKLSKIESLAKLDFGDLAKYDPLTAPANEAFLKIETEVLPLASLDEILL